MCIKIALLWLYKYPCVEVPKMQTQFKNKRILVVIFERQIKEKKKFFKVNKAAKCLI